MEVEEDLVEGLAEGLVEGEEEEEEAHLLNEDQNLTVRG